MSQLKKHILILFLMPLIAKSAFVHAIEESSSDISATDAEIAFNEATIQKEAKKVVPWYKKRIFWRDLIAVGCFVSLGIVWDRMQSVNNKTFIDKALKKFNKYWAYHVVPLSNIKNFNSNYFHRSYPLFSQCIGESEFLFASYLSNTEKNQCEADLKKLASMYETNMQEYLKKGKSTAEMKKTFELLCKKRLGRHTCTFDFVNKLFKKNVYFIFNKNKMSEMVPFKGIINNMEISYNDELKQNEQNKMDDLNKKYIKQVCSLLKKFSKIQCRP